MFEEWLIEGDFITTPRVTFEVCSCPAPDPAPAQTLDDNEHMYQSHFLAQEHAAIAYPHDLQLASYPMSVALSCHISCLFPCQCTADVQFGLLTIQFAGECAHIGGPAVPGVHDRERAAPQLPRLQRPAHHRQV